MNLRWSTMTITLFGLSLRAALAQTEISVDEPVIVDEGEAELLPLPSSTIPSEVSEEDQVVIDEVILKPDSTLVLPPFQSVVINQLIAEDGARIQIAQTGSGVDAEHGVSGGNGAHVRFFVRKIKGHVVMEARGGRGGKGRDGRDGRQGLDGERGRNARTLIFGLFWLGDGEDGRAGYPGEDGEDGEDGGNGGNGGRIAFYFQEKTKDAKIFVDVAAGEAGSGGRAGIGGLGGNGGPGGKGIKSGRQGPMGRKGKNGVAGKPGTPGIPGQAAVYQVSENLLECLMILDGLYRADDLRDEDFEMCEAEAVERSLRSKPMGMTVHSSLPVDIQQKDEMVYISSDGQDGKSAFRARNPGESAAHASSGSSGGIITIFVSEFPEFLSISARGGNGGNGADGAAGLRGRDGSDGRKAGLFKSAKPGENGGNGGDGGNGSNGGSGGKGGQVRVVYIPTEPGASDFNWTERLSVDVSGGQGGSAGRGALGGKGGLPGRGGKKFWSSSREPDGLPGVDGKDGHDGAAGLSGEAGSIEILEAESLDQFILDEFKAELSAKD